MALSGTMSISSLSNKSKTCRRRIKRWNEKSRDAQIDTLTTNVNIEKK